MGRANALEMRLLFTIYDLRFVDNVRVAQIFESSMYAGWFFKVVVMMIADYHDF